ncbi:hypothetical protein [Ahrensia sp. 13_GOM-1096m]|nr:hypothetical protein [Ahrensia sp. 13_GOM-1096m]
MMSPRVHEVNVNLPHPVLPDGDWADGFSVVVDQPFDSALTKLNETKLN